MKTILRVCCAATLCGSAFAQVPDKVDPLKATDPASLKQPMTIIPPPGGMGEATKDVGRAMAKKAIAYLVSKQDASGGWCIPTEPGRPHLPAITGLALQGMLLDADVKWSDEPAKKAAAYIISYQQPDGGIYHLMLPTYNTAISLSGLSKVDTDEARAAIKKGQDFLRNSQWGTATPMGVGGAGGKEAPASGITKDHPFYGGVGYGNRGRPDMSNTAFMLQAFHDTGVPTDDAAYQRAVVFMQRCQMLEKTTSGTVVNDMAYAKGSRQGGFIYATAENDKTVGQGQSFSGTFEETLDDGTKVSKLRAYGSISYAGFKSYLYAGLKKDDPRVVAVLDWTRRNYTVSENPGMGTDGQYYYYLMFARALDAAKIDVLDTVSADGATTPKHWRADLIAKLAELQNEDGSFKKVDDRWMEDNPVLITAYSLIALEHALH